MSEEATAVFDDPEVVDVRKSSAKRLNLNLAPKAFKDMQALSRSTQQSMTELVRIGLGLVKIAYKAKGEKLKLAVIDSNGTPLREILIP